jgi:cation transport ATPase
VAFQAKLVFEGRFENVPGHGAVATVGGRRVAVGNRRLMERERVDLGPLAARREELASGGRTVVLAAADGRPLGLVAIADAPRETSRPAVRALHDAGVQVVMLALPIAAGVFEPAFGLVLRPELAALSMSGSSLIVAVNALTLKRLRLPGAQDQNERPGGPVPSRPQQAPRSPGSFACCPERRSCLGPEARRPRAAASEGSA